MEEMAVLIARAQSGDKKARELLVENNLGLVHHIVKRFLGRGYDAQDLFQIGSIGLIKAIDKFNLDFEVCFSTYAVPMIAGEIKRFLRDDGMVKVCRTLKENGWKVKQAAEKLGQQLGRDASLDEISEETGILREDIVMALEANVEVESLYQSFYQADGTENYLIDKLGSEDSEKEKLLDHLLLKQMMEELEEKERTLIYLRYFDENTQSQVALKMGISQVQVSRMEKKILIRMRKSIIH